MKGLKESLQHVNVDVRRAGGQCVLQLVKASPRRHHELREHGIDSTLRAMYSSPHVTSVGSGGYGSNNSQMGYEEDKQVREDIKRALVELDFIQE